MTHVIAVSTNKGGVLKTTTATNLACVLAKNGKRVLIVDTDNQGNAALQFGINPDPLGFTVYDVFIGKRTAADSILQLSYKNMILDLLPANDDMTFLEHDLWMKSVRNRKFSPYLLLRSALQPVLPSYDYVLIDTGPSLGLATGNALAAADSVLIPFQPETNSMRSLVKITEAIGEYRQFNPQLSILGVLATLVDKRTTLHSAVLQECRKFCDKHNVRMLDAIVPKTVRFATSVHFLDRPASLTEETVYDEIALELGLVGNEAKHEQNA